MGIDGDVVPLVFGEPYVVDLKKFWPIMWLDRVTYRLTFLRGSLNFIADNGKLISLTSNPLIMPFETMGEELAKRYAEPDDIDTLPQS